MCGLSAVLLHPAERSRREWERIRQIFTTNLVLNEERGRHASGVALIRRDGSYQLYKRPIPATRFVNTPGYYKLLDSLDRETTCILGHTRWPTKGSERLATNNHPILTDHVIGIHNGTISNDDQLFQKYGFPRSGEVDSEVIFRLLDTADPTADDRDYADRVRETAVQLSGSYSVLSVDLRRPGRLVALKNVMPLCLHYCAELQALIFSSRCQFLRQALGHVGYNRTLPTRHGFWFDAEQLPQMGRNPSSIFTLDTNGYQEEMALRAHPAA